jgi:hypothetical protein
VIPNPCGTFETSHIISPVFLHLLAKNFGLGLENGFELEGFLVSESQQSSEGDLPEETLEKLIVCKKNPLCVCLLCRQGSASKSGTS